MSSSNSHLQFCQSFKMKQADHENLCKSTERIQGLLAELNSTLDLYYENSNESELGSLDNLNPKKKLFVLKQICT